MLNSLGLDVGSSALESCQVCRSAEAPHPVPATLRAVAKQLATVETAAERAAAESPREGQLSQVLLKLQNGLKALQELRGAFPDMPRSPTRSPNGSPKKLFARDDHDSQPSELPPFPPPHQDRLPLDLWLRPSQKLFQGSSACRAPCCATCRARCACASRSWAMPRSPSSC